MEPLRDPMLTAEVETITPHQYRQKDRDIGEKYQAEVVHLPLLEFMKWARRVEANPEAEAPKAKRGRPRSK